MPPFGFGRSSKVLGELRFSGPAADLDVMYWTNRELAHSIDKSITDDRIKLALVMSFVVKIVGQCSGDMQVKTASLVASMLDAMLQSDESVDDHDPEQFKIRKLYTSPLEGSRIDSYSSIIKGDSVDNIHVITHVPVTKGERDAAVAVAAIIEHYVFSFDKTTRAHLVQYLGGFLRLIFSEGPVKGMQAGAIAALFAREVLRGASE